MTINKPHCKSVIHTFGADIGNITSSADHNALAITNVLKSVELYCSTAIKTDLSHRCIVQ